MSIDSRRKRNVDLNVGYIGVRKCCGSCAHQMCGMGPDRGISSEEIAK